MDARLYSLVQTMRLIATTIAAIKIVAGSSTRKLPLSVALLITAPSPVVVVIDQGSRQDRFYGSQAPYRIDPEILPNALPI